MTTVPGKASLAYRLISTVFLLAAIASAQLPLPRCYRQS